MTYFLPRIKLWSEYTKSELLDGNNGIIFLQLHVICNLSSMRLDVTLGLVRLKLMSVEEV